MTMHQCCCYNSNTVPMAIKTMIFTIIMVMVKVKLSLCLTKHYAMKTYWGSGGIVAHIL
jgi:hypothetical protein